MRDLFPGYYRPTKEQFAQMWQECIFAFDANMLLNIYRYTPATREELFDIIEQLKGRTWLPHQVMLEYLDNREEVISQQNNIYDEIQDALTKVSESIEANYNRGHPFADTVLITQIIKEAAEKITASIHEAQTRYPNLLENDSLLERITNLFSGHIGGQFSLSRLEEIHEEFEQRYRMQVPPGYRDTKKEGFKKYGDGVLWFQLIEHAKDEKTPIILVIDDRKEDWWRKEKGKTLGPRPELVEEIWSKSGIAFYMYNANQFMNYAKEFLGFQVRQEAIDEVKEIEQRQEASEAFQQALDTSTARWRKDSRWLSLFPTNTITCEFPYNPHLVSSSGHLECQGTPRHKFCLNHHIKNCPIDGTVLV